MNSRIEIRPGRTINLCIHQHPTSNKTAFLIHGLVGRGAQWRFQIDMLKEKYTLIIPDLFGNGISDKPKPGKANPYLFTEFDQDLQIIFNKFANDDNIILGHSYGGAFATSLAIDHQDKISKLILVAPLACLPSVEVPLIYRLPVFMAELLRPLIEREFQKAAFDPTTNPTLVAEEMRANKTNPMYMVCAMIAGMKDITKIDATMITIPTLILLGEHDKLIRPITSREYYSALPHHQFYMIRNAAHMIQLERPSEVNELINEFLAG